MADLSDRRQQNQAFLQELEKQRLKKDCLRTIDLRGKVRGECQAYQFGGRTHHLDDRAYLLVKQLMSRFDGRYTVGVYEALFKALKQLDKTVSTPASSNTNVITLALDKALSRSEDRIVFSTPVQLRLEDVLYHGHTIDFANNSIKVSLKRAYSLHEGDKVSVHFVDFYQQTGLDMLQQVSYLLTKLEHEDNYTTVVLTRQPPVDDDFSNWLKPWLEKIADKRQIDIDNELVNLQACFYQRLWLARLSTPILWLSASDLEPAVELMHVMPPANQDLGVRKSTADILAQLPLKQFASSGNELVTTFDSEQHFSAALTQPAAVKHIINWHLTHPDSMLILLRSATVSMPAQALQQTLSTIGSVDKEQAEKLKHLYQRIQRRVSVVNLKPAFTHIQPTSTSESVSLEAQKNVSNVEALPAPSQLEPYIQRQRDRFYIHTPVTVHCDDYQWQVETLDASAEGLAIELPDDIPVSINQRLEIDFDRWQTLTKKVKLSTIPYQLKSKLFWQGKVRLGLQRIKHNCPENLNQFFEWVISHNQDSLRPNHDDAINSAEAQLFSQVLLPSLESVPLFLGLDENGQRQIQLMGETEGNRNRIDKGLYLALEQQILHLSELLKQASQTNENNLQTTLYASNRGDNWTTAFEEDFTDQRQKSLFIGRGLPPNDLRVFRCSVSTLKGSESEKEADLNRQLQQWRQQRAHRVRDIRQKLANLLGMIELTDISDVFKAFYQP